MRLRPLHALRAAAAAGRAARTQAAAPAAPPLARRTHTPRLIVLASSADAARCARERAVRPKLSGGGAGSPAAAAAAAAAGTVVELAALYADDEPAAAAAAADAADLLDSLYDDDGDEPPAAAGRVQPGSPIVAAAAPEAADGAAAATADGAAPRRAASPPRVPPTHVVAPELSGLDVFDNAVLLVDKPKGWTSFDVCNAIKKAVQRAGVKKVGHAGTLDPDATGLLIVCTGLGTKSIDGFMAAHKEYSGTLKLGEGTASLDAGTEVEERLSWEHITDEQLKEAAAKLTGDIMQVPPMYSALHHQGQRLHELARAGKTVEREARPVTITRFDVHRDEADRQLVHFYVGCTKGTYIRTLGHDLATSLGSTGHLVALRREAIGDARVDKAWEVEALVDAIFALIRQRNPDGGGGGNGSRGSRGGGRGRGRGRGGGQQGRGRDKGAELQPQAQQEQQQPQGATD